ncbi:DUF2617 family protein [Polymorphospora sp. NPDC051019]|uniref:DUF2617 family protein n=1 Tax=Polymorphospora sp. NPDC051019 TaxID=3155725 RepID=UPI00343882C9
MLVTLATPYADTIATDLSFALGLPEQPALHVLDLARLGLRLRLLGASHQVVLDTPAGPLTETVACLPGRAPALPAAVADEAAGYSFTSRVHRLDRAGMSERIGLLRGRLADDPYALVGVFPGGADAVTALHAFSAGPTVGWHTWHAYPQSGELVETETVVTVR